MRDQKKDKYKTNSHIDRVRIGDSLQLLKCTFAHYEKNTIKRVHINKSRCDGCQRWTADGPDTRH